MDILHFCFRKCGRDKSKNKRDTIFTRRENQAQL